MKIRIALTALLALVLCITLALSVSALVPTTRVSADYKTGRFYSNLISLELTGDQPTDVIMIAMSQLGYHEGTGTYDFDGLNTSGGGNYVEYNYAFGLVDGNSDGRYEYGYAWCAAFVSWCLKQAGVNESTVKPFVSCSNWATWFRQNSLYSTRPSGYIPRGGDLIFFKDAGANRASTHVGIVIYTDATRVYTVEGNTSGEVGVRSYSLNDSYIVGYGTPEYTENTTGRLDFSRAVFGGGRYILKGEQGFRAGPSASSAYLGKIARGTMVEVEYIENGWGRIVYNGRSGWIYMDHAYLVSYDIFEIQYHTDGDAPPDAFQQKREGVPVRLSDIIPSLEGHTFVGWACEPDGDAMYYPSQEYGANADLVLYAVWERDIYRVEFRDHNGEIIASESYGYMDRITPPNPPERSGDDEFVYVFSGWDALPEYALGDVTVTAVYEAVRLPQTTLVPDTSHMTDAIETEPRLNESNTDHTELHGTSAFAAAVGCSMSLSMIALFVLALLSKTSPKA